MNHKYSLLWVFLMFIYPIIFMFQGLDFTDQGFWFVGYQRIFNDPSSVESMMATWLSLLIGGLIDLLGFGVISFRIAFVVLTWATIYMVYKFLKEFFDKEEILLPLFVTLVYITKWGVNWISYNDLSAIFYLAGGIAIWKGLQLNSVRWTFLSGSILGIGFYLRLPNIVGLALVVTILFASYIYKWRVQQTIKFVIFFIFGFGLALFLGFFVITLLGHQEYFLNSLYELRKQSGNAGYHHSSSILISMLLQDHIKAFRYAFMLVTFLILVNLVRHSRFFTKIYQKKFYFEIAVLGFLIASIALAFYLEQGMRYRWALPGFCYAILTIGIIEEYKVGSRSHALLYFIALTIFFLVPLGSANGIGNAIYGSWLALPLMFLILTRSVSSQILVDKVLGFYEISATKSFLAINQNKSHLIKFIRVPGFSSLLMIAILLFSVHLTYKSCYRDGGDRLSLRYSVNSSLLSWIFTSKSRANVVSELLEELQYIAKKDDSLLAAADIPMLNYLTGMRPYTSNSWIGIMDRDTLAADLIERSRKNKGLPIVVITKGSVHNSEWPNIKLDKNYMGDNEFLIRNFIYENKYQKKWENQWFEIWTLG